MVYLFRLRRRNQFGFGVGERGPVRVRLMLGVDEFGVRRVNPRPEFLDRLRGRVGAFGRFFDRFCRFFDRFPRRSELVLRGGDANVCGFELRPELRDG